jgi:hypothetical protein
MLPLEEHLVFNSFNRSLNLYALGKSPAKPYGIVVRQDKYPEARRCIMIRSG